MPGLSKFKESVKRDIEAIEKVRLTEPSRRPLRISTNAPYLLAVWKECISARQPIASITQHLSYHHSASQERTFSASALLLKTKENTTEHGVKIDVIADGGRHWIRVNTITATRLAYEFQELDAYISDSSSASSEYLDEAGQTDINPKPNSQISLIRMAKLLIAASRANPLPLLKGEAQQIPKVTMRLTRLEDYTARVTLEAAEDDKGLADRISQVIEDVRQMGIELEFGERELSFAVVSLNSALSNAGPKARCPTIFVNLDLSVLIALVSDLTHCALPATAEEAISRFQARGRAQPFHMSSEQHSILLGHDSEKGPQGHVPQSRALAQQLQQEMKEGFLDILRRRLSYDGKVDEVPVEFWTTSEARDRFFDIVFTIGGENEKRRAEALFSNCSRRSADERLADTSTTVEERRRLYWLGSRYSTHCLPPITIRVVDAAGTSGDVRTVSQSSTNSAVSIAIAKTCRELLSHQDGSKAKAKAKITPHTLRSLLFGAARGWTTLTANRASIKALVSEVRARYGPSLQLYGEDTMDAAVWIVNPRSLAEGMYKDTQG
ncbi:hypothetical protein NEOLEDRAFT_1093876 [Neolentinus lepideus HHB14362 ss-1]|uniref:Uncharacterized protein n=1 Tax=Neolentinus lepideus HHB14362 ss-1 TaxID=1314782 RepID=A0A165S3Z9_9AGAM|nr:hypothetical protein NEOLEDRAFT_1093876 [Neolentinus lepideus HHB14362 ss-1]